MSRQQPTEPSGPLAGHVRERRRYLPPLAATGVLEIGDWVRDDLPDLIWPVLALAEYGSQGALKFVRWQQAVQRDLADLAQPQQLAEGLDGRLTSLDRLVQEVPSAEQMVKRQAKAHDLLPPRSLKRFLRIQIVRPPG